ncbi:rod-binding protein [Pseudohoeflea suaedae]|nr:rod-binding protein [Pseudohoeflea suaedae]
MAISVPSDLVLDVVNAASPEAARKAENMLAAAAATKARASAATDRFTTEVADLRGDTSASLVDLRSRLEAAASEVEVPEAYRKFEAMVLGNFVQSMLPSDNEDVYGKGTAGDIWKGMMADKIGQVISEGGGIGIAERMAKQAANLVVPAGALSESVVNKTANLVSEVQMTILDDVTGIGDHAKDKGGKVL